MTFQWRFNNANLGGATNAALFLANVSATSEGQYRVVLTNPSGSVTSAPAMLWIDNDGDGLGDSWELTHFGNLNQNATTDSDGDGISNLREFINGSDPTSSGSARYRLLVIREGGAVIRNPDQITYSKGQSVALTATAGPNELFHAWLGDVVSRDNPVTLVMTNDKTVFARFTPISFLWTNGTSGDWDVATNWTPRLVPGTNDIVLITSGVTVTLNSAADCAEVTLGSSSASATLTGSGTLRIRDNFFWTGGAMTGSGRTILESNVILTIEGNVGLTTRTLENRGTIRWSGVSLGLGSGAVITNTPGALFRVDSPNGFLGGTQARFDNAGLFRKSTGGGTLSVGSFFNNSGTVEIEAGTLVLNNGGTNSGSFALPAGTGLTFAEGTHFGTVSSSITGAGHLTFNGSAATFAGFVNVSGSNTFSSGTIRLTGDYICTNNAMTISGGAVHLTGNHLCTNNTLTISSGLVNFSGSGLVSPAIMHLVSGTLDGSAIVTVGNAMNWSGGTMSGSGRTIIPTGVTLNAALPSGGGLNGRTLENGGTVLWTGAGNIGFVSAAITNRAGALFHAQSAGGFAFVSGPNRFDNAGTFRKSVNAGTLDISGSGSFNNFGTVEIQTGTLLFNAGFTNAGAVQLSSATTNRLAGGGSATGTFVTPSTALVEWTGGTFTLNPGAQLNGAGPYKLGGGILTANANLTVTNLEMANGTLDGTGTVTIASIMNWTAGTMDGSGRTIIPAGTALQVGSSTGVSLKRTLENGGSAVWSGSGPFIMLNGVVTNRAGALFHAQNASQFFYAGGGCRFDNAGIFRKTTSTGTTTAPSGVPFNNSGTVDIRSGILAVNGGYISSSNALLNCALGGTTAGTNYGQLQVAGTVMLNGALSVDLINGFIPATNNTFTVLTAGTRIGAFNNFLYPSNAVTMQLSNSPSSVIVRVTDVFAPVPQPLLFPPELVGVNLKLSWTSVSNTSYRLEFNPNLIPSNWTALPGDVTATNATASKLDPLTPSNRLYRVRVLP